LRRALQVRGPSARTKRRERTCSLSFAPLSEIRFRRSAKRELFELDDETFLRAARAILDLQEAPRPRGYDKVAGREDQRRIWVGRDHRVLYEIDEKAGRIIIVGARRKDESTYKLS
jgi:mRNA-degrading endonuclease RelE of RelBE toxin-antitoxin system